MIFGADVGNDDMGLGLLGDGDIEVVQLGIGFSAQAPILVPGEGFIFVFFFDGLLVLVVPEIAFAHFHAAADGGLDFFDLFKSFAGDVGEGLP